MQTNLNTQVVTRLALGIAISAVLCFAQQQNVGAVGRGVSISFQKADGSAGRGVSVGFQDAAGTISVTTNLAAASFTITGPNTYIGSGTSFAVPNAPAGTYTITYGAVNYYCAPVSETKTLAAGGTLAFTPGNYQGPATITVNVTPVGATSATFSINPPIPGMPNTGPYPRTHSNLLPQTYTVSFNPVAGFTTPPPQTAAPNSACQLSFAGTYASAVSPGTATLSVAVSQNTNSLGKFTIADSQGRVVAAAVSSFGPSPLAAGKYTIKYAPLAGFYTPPDRTLILNAGESANIQGKYRRLLVVSFTGWNNAPNASSCPSSSGSGIQYFPDQWNQQGTGMTRLLLELLGDPAALSAVNISPTTYAALKPGAVVAAFTFYTSDGQGHYIGDACNPPSVPTDLIPVSTQGDHAQAGRWIDDQRPTADDIVAVVGHSYGGNRARFFVEQLQRKGIATDLLVTVDPVDWGNGVTGGDGCRVPSTLADLLVGCDQSSWRRGPSSARSVISYYQVTGLPVPFLGESLPVMGYQMTGAKLALNAGVSHTQIDENRSVHMTILDAMSGLTRGPKTLTATTAGTPSRDASGLNYPIRATATAFGTAVGFGTATGVKVISASLNGVPVTSMSPSPSIGDIPAGSSSNPITLRFPTSAAAAGTAVLLTVTFENSDGALYTNTLRQVAP